MPRAGPHNRTEAEIVQPTDPTKRPDAATDRSCEDEIVAVARRARAGLVTIAVAVLVAALTLAGAVATLLATGFIPLSGLEGRIATAIEERLGEGWNVTADSAEITRTDGHAQLRVRQVAFRHASGAMFRAPEAELGYDPFALLRGSIRLTSVELRGVNIRLGVNSEGALVVNADAAPIPITVPQAIPDPGHWNAFTGIMGAIGALAGDGGLLGSLETAGMRGARLYLVDPDGVQKAGLEDVDIRLTRAGEGVSRLTMKGRIGSRWKELAADLSRDASGTRRAEIEIVRFEPAAAVQLAFGTGMTEVEGMPLTGRLSLTETSDGRRTIGGRLALQPGRMHFGSAGMGALELKAASVEFESRTALSDLAIRSANVTIGDTELTARGELRDENGVWALGLDGDGRIAGVGADKPAQLDSYRLDLRYDAAAGETRISRLALRGPAVDAEVNGSVRRGEAAPAIDLSVRAVESDARALLAIWPRFTSPIVHDVLTRQLTAAHIERVDVTVRMSSAEHAAIQKGLPMPDEAVRVVVEGSRAHFLPAPGLPPLAGGVARGVITGRTVSLTIPNAVAELGDGRTLALTEGSFAMADTWTERAPARIAFRSVGGADALAALFAQPALREHVPAGLDPAVLRGQAELSTTIAMPLMQDVRMEEIDIRSQGRLTGVNSDTLLAPEKLENGQFTVGYDRNGLSVKGDARVGGDRAQIEVRQNAKGQGEATLAFTLDNAARQRRGFAPEIGLTGMTPVKVSKPLGRAAGGPVRVEIDLTRSALDTAMPGLAKAAGRPGRMAFNLRADPDGPDLEDFLLEAGSVSIRGKVELDRNNGFDSASFSSFRLSPGDNLRVDLRRDGQVTKATVRGAVADVRPFLSELQAPSSPAPARGGGSRNASGGDIDLDVEVPIMAGHNDEAITDGKLRLSKRGGELRSISLEGRIGRGPLSVQQSRERTAGSMVIQAGNGGSLLRFLDLYRRAHGGDLTMTVGTGGVRQPGELLYRDFLVRDEPALRRVIGQQPAPNADTAGAETRRIDTSQVAFTKLRTAFVRSAGRLELSDMVIWGQQIGFTLQGSIDYARDRVDIGGTFVPGYAFNNAFAQVPLLGALLGGGSQYGGLFALNFRLSGAASAPTMTINPLSAIAPGILRRFVDPLGGAPMQAPPQQPRRGAER